MMTLLSLVGKLAKADALGAQGDYPGVDRPIFSTTDSGADNDLSAVLTGISACAQTLNAPASSTTFKRVSEVVRSVLRKR